MSTRLLLYGVLGAAALGVGAVALLPGAPPAPANAGPTAPPPARVAVLVAARPVQGGVLLKPEDIGAAQVALAELPEGAIRDTPTARADAVGAMVRRTVSKDEALRPEVLLRPGEHGFLAAVLGPGMRAVTVGVDAVSGTAGLIWPGDRVDLILTQSLDEEGGGGGRAAPGRRVVGETVLSAVRVIAVDRSLVQGAQPGGLADGVRADGNRTVTLEVSADAATRVSVASRLGRLSLSVRAAGTPVEAAAVAGGLASSPRPAAVWASDVSAALASRSPAPAATGAPPAGGGATVRVFKGTADVEEIRFR